MEEVGNEKEWRKKNNEEGDREREKNRRRNSWRAQYGQGKNVKVGVNGE